MLNLKCQFWYPPQRASLARVGSQIWKLRKHVIQPTSDITEWGFLFKEPSALSLSTVCQTFGNSGITRKPTDIFLITHGKFHSWNLFLRPRGNYMYIIIWHSIQFSNFRHHISPTPMVAIVASYYLWPVWKLNLQSWEDLIYTLATGITQFWGHQQGLQSWKKWLTHFVWFRRKRNPFPPTQCWSESCCQKPCQIPQHWFDGGWEGLR